MYLHSYKYMHISIHIQNFDALFLLPTLRYVPMGYIAVECTKILILKMYASYLICCTCKNCMHRNRCQSIEKKSVRKAKSSQSVVRSKSMLYHIMPFHALQYHAIRCNEILHSMQENWIRSTSGCVMSLTL